MRYPFLRNPWYDPTRGPPPYFLHRGVDFLFLMRWILTAPTFEEMPEPELVLPRVTDAVVAGRAWHGKHVVEVFLYDGRDVFSTSRTLLHELCHLRCDPKEHHGSRFKRTFRAGAMEAFGIDVPGGGFVEMGRMFQERLSRHVEEVGEFWEAVGIAGMGAAR